jgi:hypothetical protein
MKRSRFVWIAGWLCLCFSQLYVLPILAHEAALRLQLSQYELQAGDSVQISGTNLVTDMAVEISLVNEATHTAVSLGEALCDGNGAFLQTFTLPPKLTPGIYTLQAIDHSIVGMPTAMASAPLRVISDTSWLPAVFGLTAVVLIGLCLGLFYRQRQGDGIVKRPISSKA